MLSALTEWGISIHYVCRKVGKIWKLAEGKCEVTCYREQSEISHHMKANRFINFLGPLSKMI